MNDHTPTTRESIAPRTHRALTEKMTTYPLEGDVYSVTTESGREYRVDARDGRCSCPDAEHNLPDGVPCKHARRVAICLGNRALPVDLIDTDAVDPLLGAHVDGAPRVVATDGGELEASSGDAAAADEDTGEDRPEGCQCASLGASSAVLPCWPCWREGHRTPADVDDDAVRREERDDLD